LFDFDLVESDRVGSSKSHDGVVAGIAGLNDQSPAIGDDAGESRADPQRLFGCPIVGSSNEASGVDPDSQIASGQPWQISLRADSNRPSSVHRPNEPLVDHTADLFDESADTGAERFESVVSA